MTARGGVGSRVYVRFMVGYAADQSVGSLIFVVLGWISVNAVQGVGGLGVLGVMGVAKFGALFFVGGPLGDRYGRTPVIERTIDGRVLMLVLLGVIVLSGAWPGLLVAWAVGYGLLDGVHEPNLGAMTADVAELDEQTTAQGWLDALRRTALVLGGPIAGGLMSFPKGYLWALLLAAALLLICRRCLPPHDGRLVPPSASWKAFVGHLWRSDVEGWREIGSMPVVRSKLALFAVANFALSPAMAGGLPLLGKAREWGSVGYGAVYGSFAVGGILAAILVAKYDEAWKSYRVLIALITLVPSALGLAVLGWIPTWPAAVGLLLVTGFLSGLGPTLLTGAMRETTPKRLHSRLLAVRGVAITSGLPLGYVVLSALSGTLGLAEAMTVLGCFLALVAGSLLLARPSRLFAS